MRTGASLWDIGEANAASYSSLGPEHNRRVTAKWRSLRLHVQAHGVELGSGGERLDNREFYRVVGAALTCEDQKMSKFACWWVGTSDRWHRSVRGQGDPVHLRRGHWLMLKAAADNCRALFDRINKPRTRAQVAAGGHMNRLKTSFARTKSRTGIS